MIGSKTPSEQWREIVKQYSEKAFTRPWDILPGLAGIARQFHRDHELGDYLPGLWSKDLLRWLCWKSVRIALWGAVSSGCDRCGVWPRRLKNAPPQAHFAMSSFSWASRIGACEYLDEPWNGAYQQVCEIKGVHLESVPENPFGRFKSCSLRLHGWLQGMAIMSTVNKDRKYTSGCRTEYAYLFDPPAYRALEECDLDERFNEAELHAIAFDFDAVDDIPADGQIVQLLELFRKDESSIALVLVRQDDGDAESVFRRIGICMHTKEPLDLSPVYKQDIVLV